MASLTLLATFRPRFCTTAAAARMSSMRLLVQEPMKTLSMQISVMRLAGLQAHIGQRALDGGAFVGVLFFVGIGHAGVDAQRPSPGWCPRSPAARCRPACSVDDGIQLRIVVGVQGLPVGHGLVPFGAGGRPGGGP